MTDTRSSPGIAEAVRIMTLWFEQQIENAQQDQISGFAGGTAAGTLRGERAHARHCAMYEAKQAFLKEVGSVGVAQGSQEPSKFSPGDPVEVRKVADEIDEIVIRRGDVHIEQMDDSGWFMGVDASDGSYWQFWFGAKNRKSHVHFRHTETVPSTHSERGNRFCKREACAYPDCLVEGGVCPSQPPAHRNTPQEGA